MPRREYPLLDKTRRTIFQNLTTWESLVRDLRDLRLQRNELIHCAVVGTKYDLLEILTGKTIAGVEPLSHRRAFAHFRLTRKFGRETEHTVTGQFVATKYLPRENIYILLSVATPRFWREGLLPFIEKLYPRITRPFLKQSEMQALLRKVQSVIQRPELDEAVLFGPGRGSLPEGLRILEFSSKKRLASSARKRFRTAREWTDADLNTVFKEAKDENIWFRSISFDLVKKAGDHLVSTGVRGRLSKYGSFSCTGEYELFQKTIIDGMAHYAADRIQFFSNRDRISNPEHAIRPVEITYERDIFKSKDQSRRLLEALQKFQGGTCTVLHGNPYIHVSLVDNTDFSAADVWVLSDNQIMVVPQLKASEAALKRFVNHIFEHFSEGNLSEFQEATI